MLDDLMALAASFAGNEYEQFNEAFQQVPENYPAPYRIEVERLLASDMPEYVAVTVARISVLTTFAIDRESPLDETFRSAIDIQCTNPTSFTDRTWTFSAHNTVLVKMVLKTLPVAHDDHLRVMVYDNVDHGGVVLRRLVEEFWETNHSAMLHEAGLEQLLLAELIPTLGLDMRRIYRCPRNQFLNSELTYYLENEITTGRLHEVQLIYPALPES